MQPGLLRHEAWTKNQTAEQGQHDQIVNHEVVPPALSIGRQGLPLDAFALPLTGLNWSFMTYTQAVDHLYALAPELAPTPGAGPVRKFDLAHMRTLCAFLGDPQARVPAILIAGTNGKGSTAATLASILTMAGYRTGLYTSPHLSRPNERIQLAHAVLPSEYGNQAAHADGPLRLTQIADEDFARLYTQVDEACLHLTSTGALPGLPSFFERLTALAFLYFAGPPAQGGSDEEVQAPAPAEIMVLEVGLGGRLDATNVVEPMISIVADIALDHQDYLGNTIAEITAEKCGILRENGVLVTLPQLPEANQAIGVAATALAVRAINAADYIPPPSRTDGTPVSSFRADSPSGIAPVDKPIPSPELPANRYTLTVAHKPLQVDSPLPGHHQQRNIALAIAAALELRQNHGYNIPDLAIEHSMHLRRRIATRCVRLRIRRAAASRRRSLSRRRERVPLQKRSKSQSS